MRRLLCTIILALLPSALHAQSTRIYIRHSRSDCCWGNRFSLEPYVGAIKDPYDISPDDKNTSALFGFRVGYRTGARTRLLGNIGYTKSENVNNPQALSSYYVYDNTWLFTTAGAEFDVVPGNTSASLGLQGGAAWRRTDLESVVGSPIGSSEEDRGFNASAVVIPSLTLRHRVSSRLGLMLSVHDNIFDVLEGPAQHGVGASIGVAFR